MVDELKQITETVETANKCLPKTMNAVDNAVSTIIGFFDNVVLYPMKKANINYSYKLENFAKDIQEKSRNIPQDALQVPPVSISGPILENLKYFYDEDELRNMFEDMLVTSMDSRKTALVHKSYVEVIKQMEPLDAKVLQWIDNNCGVSTAHARLVFKSDPKLYYREVIPYYYSEQLLQIGDPFLVSKSIANLVRLGLLVSSPAILTEKDVNSVKMEKYIQEQYSKYNTKEQELDIEVSYDGNNFSIDTYGSHFIKVCMRDL